MPRPREYDNAAQKQQAYRDRRAKVQDEVTLDRCAWYSVRDAMLEAGFSVEGETRAEILRMVCKLIERERNGVSAADVVFPAL